MREFDFYQQTDERWYRDIVREYYHYDCLDSAKIISDNKEWIPIFCLQSNILRQSRQNDYNRGIQGVNWETKRNLEYFEKRGIKVDEKLFSPVIMQCMYKAMQALIKASGERTESWRMSLLMRRNHAVLDKLSDNQIARLLCYFVRKEQKKLEKWIISKKFSTVEALDPGGAVYGNLWRWDSIIKAMNSFNGFSIKRPRSATPAYVIGPKYLARVDRALDTTVPLACLMIKKQYLPYYKAALAVNDPIDSRFCQLWVQKGFDHKNTADKTVRPKYRKYFKKQLVEEEVEVVEHDNLMAAIFATFHLPKLDSLEDFEKFLENASKEVTREVKFNY